jgi:RNA polymerase alpha subunit
MENSRPRPVIRESKAARRRRLDRLMDVLMAQGWAEDEARKLALIQIKKAPRKNMVRKNRKREVTIVKSRQAGASFAAIGRQHGLSAQRVRQIFVRAERENNSPFKLLGLNRRLLDALASSGFKTIEQVASTSNEELLKLRNVGKIRLLEIRKALLNGDGRAERT